MKTKIQTKTRMHLFGLTVVVACFTGAAGIARADLTLNGAVGLPLNPTAQIPGTDGIRVQGNYYDLGDVGGDLNLLGVYGAGRLTDRLEVNGGLERVSGDGALDPLDETSIAIGVKYLVTRQTEETGQDLGGVRIAVGAGYSRALLRNKHAYVVATKDFSGLSGSGRPPGLVHLGLRYDDFDGGGALAGDSSRVSIYGGIEVPLDRQGRLHAVGELQTKNSDFGSSEFPYSASLRYRTEAGFSASAGLARQGLTGDNGLFVQVGKTF